MAAASRRPAALRKTQFACQCRSLAANPSGCDSFHTQAGQLRNGGRGLGGWEGEGAGWVGGGRPWRRAGAAVGLQGRAGPCGSHGRAARRAAGSRRDSRRLGRREPARSPGPAHTLGCLQPCRGPARVRSGPCGREEAAAAGPARPGGADYRRQRAAPPVAMVTPLPAGGASARAGRGGGGLPPSLPPSPPPRQMSPGPAAVRGLTGPRPRPLTPSRAAPALRPWPRGAARAALRRAGRGSGPRGSSGPSGGQEGGRLPRTKMPGQGLGRRALAAPWPVPTPAVAQPILVPRPRASSSA